MHHLFSLQNLEKEIRIKETLFLSLRFIKGRFIICKFKSLKLHNKNFRVISLFLLLNQFSQKGNKEKNQSKIYSIHNLI